MQIYHNIYNLNWCCIEKNIIHILYQEGEKKERKNLVKPILVHIPFKSNILQGKKKRGENL